MWTLAETWALWRRELVLHGPQLVMRTIITFVIVLFVVRWTGKRSVASLAPFDLALVILIGEVAAIPVTELQVHMLHGILPVLLMGFLHVLMTTINMHSRTFEQWTEGTPTLLVKDGQVLRQNLLKERVSLADLEVALRHRNVTSLSEVRQAWMEPAGGISVIRALPEARPSPELARALGQIDQIEQIERIEQIIADHNARLRQELEQLIREHLKSPGG